MGATLAGLLGACVPRHPVVTPGASAPDFELSALDGRTVHLADHLGRDVVLLDFWATFCGPCLSEMPRLDALYRRQRARGFVVIGISVDDADSLSDVRRVTAGHASFPVLLDTEARVIPHYDPSLLLPYEVLIGRDGVVISTHAGYAQGDAAALEREIEAALRAPPSAR